MPSRREGLPAWLRPEVARGIAAAARTALGTRDSPEDVRAAVRAVAVACLPSLPAHLMRELLDAVAPADPNWPEHTMPSLAPADAHKLAGRLAVLAGSGGNAPPEEASQRLAARLAGAGVARIGPG